MEAETSRFWRNQPAKSAVGRLCAVAVLLLVLSSFVEAQEPLGQNPTGRSISPPSSATDSSDAIASPGEGRSLGTTLVALGVIFLFALGLIRLWQKRHPELARSLPADVWESLGSAPIDAKFQVRLIRLGTRVLVLGQSDQQLQTLSEIIDPEEVAQLTALCQSQAESTENNRFRDLYRQFVGQIQTPATNSDPAESREPHRG